MDQAQLQSQRKTHRPINSVKNIVNTNKVFTFYLQILMLSNNNNNNDALLFMIIMAINKIPRVRQLASRRVAPARLILPNLICNYFSSRWFRDVAESSYLRSSEVSSRLAGTDADLERRGGGSKARRTSESRG